MGVNKAIPGGQAAYSEYHNQEKKWRKNEENEKLRKNKE